MDNSHNITGTDSSNPIPEKEPSQKISPPFDQLSKPLLTHILSYVHDTSTRQSTALVGKLWTTQTVGAAKNREQSLIKNFVEFLSENLDKQSYATQIKQLSDIVSDTKIFDSINLITLKSSINEQKDAIVNILKSLDENDLNVLEKLYENKTKPQFFEDIFYLARFYKKIEGTNQIPNEYAKRCALESIIKNLIQDNQYDINKSETIIDKIPDEFAKGVALKVLFDKLIPVEVGRFDTSKKVKVIDRNTIDRAKIIANKITDEWQKDSALDSLIHELMHRNEFGDAEQIADELSNSSSKSRAFLSISTACAERRNFNGAEKNADKIPEKSMRIYTLKRIFEMMMEARGIGIMKIFNQAKGIADKVSSEWFRLHIFKSIIDKLVQSERFDDAKTVAKEIPKESIKKEALNKISLAHVKDLAEQGLFDKTKTIVNEISNEFDKGVALQFIIEELIKLKRFDEARATANEITDLFIKGEAFKRLSQAQQE